MKRDGKTNTSRGVAWSDRTGQDTQVAVAAQEDFPAADQLLDAVYASCAGPTDRAVEPRRTDPVTMRRFLATSAGRLVGTATFSPAGGVLDWAVSDGGDGDAIGAALLAAGESWVREQGGTEILLYTPPGNHRSEQSLRQLGFHPVRSPYVVMQVVHFPVLFDAIARTRTPRFQALSPFTLAIHLERGLYPPLPEPDLRVLVTPEGVTVQAGTGPADATLSATATAFSEFLFGARDLACFVEIGATISPNDRKDEALRLVSLLPFDRPWFVPLGEKR